MASSNTDDGYSFMKQESVMSLYEPVPISPTTATAAKSFLQPTPEAEAPRNGSETVMKRNVSYGNLMNQTEARVLVLYTGGTIGMLRNDKNGELLRQLCCI
jgi:L-asparaginase/Glu-tRNA(Gln) amidotransferase subunit D